MEQRIVYELGYSSSGKCIAELMAAHPDLLLIDTRETPHSTVPYFAQFNQAQLETTYGERYHFAGRYLGNVNHRSKGAPIKIAQPERGIHGLITYLSEGHDLILLCACGAYANCHRHVIVEALQKELGKRGLPAVDIVHSYRYKPMIAVR